MHRGSRCTAMASDAYDIAAAFAAIEDELIASMIRNMDRHRAEEGKEGFLWSQWQVEQLSALEEYKARNQKRYGGRFRMLNRRVESLIRIANDMGNMDQEAEILKAIRDGFRGYSRASETMQAEFFRLNSRKLEALVKATITDMQKAETAVLRMADDQYRKAIFKAQVYANTGAGTYEKAVDMATKDMLAAGLNCIQYANGARHTLSDYADMAIRTASKRAYLQGEGVKRQEWGIATVILNKRGNPCPKCLPWVGKVLVDDVWSGGKADDGKYPLMSYAISKGLYHPRCKDAHTTYFPGISTADDTWTKEELEKVGLENKKEAMRQHAERQAKKYGRMAGGSLDKGNKKAYGAKAKAWEDVAKRDEGGIIQGGWPQEAIESRTRDEKIIHGYKVEHAVLYDASGKRIWHKKGKDHAVGFTSKEIKQMAGGVLTHNHPLGATFSEADIYLLKSTGLSQIRAIGRDGVYTLKRPSAWPDGLDSLQKVKEEYQRIEESLKEVMEKEFREKNMTPEEYNIVYQNKIMERLSEKFGLDYGMEAWEQWKR